VSDTISDSADELEIGLESVGAEEAKADNFDFENVEEVLEEIEEAEDVPGWARTPSFIRLISLRNEGPDSLCFFFNLSRAVLGFEEDEDDLAARRRKMKEDQSDQQKKQYRWLAAR
jgi:hypothetical protein